MNVSFTAVETNKLTEFDTLRIQEIDDRAASTAIQFLDGTVTIIKEHGEEIDKRLKECNAELFIKLTKCWDGRNLYCNTHFITTFVQNTNYTRVDLRNGQFYLVKENAAEADKLSDEIYRASKKLD